MRIGFLVTVFRGQRPGVTSRRVSSAAIAGCSHNGTVRCGAVQSFGCAPAQSASWPSGRKLLVKRLGWRRESSLKLQAAAHGRAAGQGGRSGGERGGR